jgi:chemotaxis signal transduction protein
MEKQILFRLGEQFFAVPISDTDKIIRIENRTIVPDVSSYILGIQEVEGIILPLVDLANRFYQGNVEDFATSDVMVVNWKDKKIGLVVDEVTTVEEFDEEQRKEKNETKHVVDGVSTSYITAFVQSKNGIVPILNVHALFSSDQADEIRELLEIEGVQS